MEQFKSLYIEHQDAMFSQGKKNQKHTTRFCFPSATITLLFYMKYMIIGEMKKKIIGSNEGCFMEDFYELTIFEKYFLFEIIIEYFEYMGFYAYMLSFLAQSYI